MRSTTGLGLTGRRLLRVLVNEISHGRFVPYDQRTFIPYSEVLSLLGVPAPDIYPGIRLQPEGLNELDEWTKENAQLPKITGLIVDKANDLPNERYAMEYGFKPGEDCPTGGLRKPQGQSLLTGHLTFRSKFEVESSAKLRH